MQINVNQASSNQVELEKSNSSASSKVSQQSSAAQSSVVDRASLTSDSTEVNALQQQALALPDVRADKVAALKQQVQSGSYDHSPAATAKAMSENGF